MNFLLRTEFNLTALAAVISPIAFLSCSNKGSEGSTCGVTLLPAEQTTNTGTQKQISFVGALPETCKRETAERTGRTVVKLTTQASQPSELVVLDELKAGQRSLKFDATSDNLRRGSFEKSFDSTLLPDWSVPWSDRPTTISLSLLAPSSIAADTLPRAVNVELKF